MQVLASSTVNFLGPIPDHPSHFLSRDKCSFPGQIPESEVWESKTCNFIEMCGVVTSSMRSTGQSTVHAFLTWDPISWSTTPVQSLGMHDLWAHQLFKHFFQTVGSITCTYADNVRILYIHTSHYNSMTHTKVTK